MSATVVNAEDQLLINKFARLYQEQTQLKIDIKTAENEVANINEAGDEILLLDDADAASIPLQIGLTFIHFDSDTLNDRLEKLKSEAEEVLGVKKARIDQVSSEMDNIRKVLYGKFGDRINLESEKDE
ncbi:unnamed protein product [Caenorhabditis angaria]|uniref:Prefoldin subunit 4 n=1 Tax=Caenorhabditis angaria TaxID=860376 RepID=A0A9P1IPB8_9PELO|nr:unnamed protein product [Caenorhabditis angaria]